MSTWLPEEISVSCTLGSPAPDAARPADDSCDVPVPPQLVLTSATASNSTATSGTAPTADMVRVVPRDRFTLAFHHKTAADPRQ